MKLYSTQQERNEIILKNRNLVHYILKGMRIQPGTPDYEDLFSVGVIELIRVIDAFDKDKGFAFTTYAYPCIKGAIQRYIREKTTIIKLPRGVIDNRISALEKLNVNESLTSEELQSLLVWDYSSLDADIDTSKDEGGITLMDTLQDYKATDELNEFINYDYLESCIEELLTHYNGRTRGIIDDFYYSTLYDEGMKQRELAKKYNVSQSYAARILQKAHKRFKMILKKNGLYLDF